MLQKCYLCRIKISTKICGLICKKCYKNFQENKKNTNSLFFYETNLRYLILKAKIDGDHFAIFSLCEIFANHKITAKIIKKVDAISPAPSSLYSRLLGRFDLAYFLAFKVAKKYQKPLCLNSNKLYWNLSKRAFLKRAQKIKLSSTSKTDKRKTILIIDDVLTTGYTMLRVFKYLPDEYTPRYLTLAYSK